MGLLMDELKAALRIVLANKFLMYFKAQSYHWNVEGMFFPQLHDFFGKIYEEVYGSIDTAAEELRALDAYAPVSINELYNYATVEEDLAEPPAPSDMIQNLFIANAKVIEKRKKIIGRLAMRLAPRVRKIEKARLSHTKFTQGAPNVAF